MFFHRLPIITLLLLTITVAAHAHAGGNKVAYKGMHIGQDETSLPDTIVLYFLRAAGLYDNDYFHLWTLKRKVNSLEIIYDGETVDGEKIHKSVNLRQAVREHSLRFSTTPRLGITRQSDGTPSAVIDIGSHIVYSVSQIEPDAQVFRVSYWKSDSPVFDVPQQDMLSSDMVAKLIEVKNESSSLKEPPTITLPVDAEGKTVIKEKLRPAATSKEVTDGFIFAVDTAIGRGKRTLALINDTESWLTISEQHEDAIETFNKLRYFYARFKSDMTMLRLSAQSGADKIDESAKKLIDEPLQIEAVVERSMHQIIAMGFDPNW